jgi:hypothetical protein
LRQFAELIGPQISQWQRRTLVTSAGTAPGGKLIGIRKAADFRTGARRGRSVDCWVQDHPAEPDIATQAAQHGSAMTTIDWARLLRCTECDVRDADFDLTGERQ